MNTRESLLENMRTARSNLQVLGLGEEGKVQNCLSKMASSVEQLNSFITTTSISPRDAQSFAKGVALLFEYQSQPTIFDNPVLKSIMDTLYAGIHKFLAGDNKTLLLQTLEAAIKEFKDINNLDDRSWFSMFKVHGMTGLQQATILLNKVQPLYKNKQNTSVQMLNDMKYHLEHGPGNWFPQSFKPILKKHLDLVVCIIETEINLDCYIEKQKNNLASRKSRVQRC